METDAAFKSASPTPNGAASTWSETSTTTHESSDGRILAYSGPTLLDIQKALFVTTDVAGLEREMNKVESRYTLKIKCNDNATPEDGYKWRKYGQKSIKNTPNPRSYYKCTNPRCGAKKQVERSWEDPQTLVITYEGLHLHFTFPHFFSGQPHPDSPPAKKPKITHAPQEESVMGPAQIIIEPGPMGLLEDLVPSNVLNPAASSTSSFSDNGYSPSSASPPTSESPSDSHLFFDFDANPAFLFGCW